MTVRISKQRFLGKINLFTVQQHTNMAPTSYKYVVRNKVTNLAAFDSGSVILKRIVLEG